MSRKKFFWSSILNDIQLRGFVTEWETTTSNETITLPLTNNGTYDCTVDWGDSSSESIINSYNDSNRIHTYTNPGIYQVEIKGECPGWSFNNSGDRLKIKKIINWGDISLFGGFQYLVGGFYGCTNLTSLGVGKILAKSTLNSLDYCFRETKIKNVQSGLFDNCVNLSSGLQIFHYCIELETIPSNLFDAATGITSFPHSFYFCSKLTSIPNGLFDNNTLVTTFFQTFGNCSSLTEIPEGLFDNNTLASVNGFRDTFYQCTGITSIPEGLFDNNTLVTANGFSNTFSYCLSLTEIPDGLFDNNTQVSLSGFRRTFYNCINLESVPSGLFRNNVNVGISGFTSTFYNCPKLVLNKYIFYNSGEESTRFLNKVSNFNSCFSFESIFSYSGSTIGEAPELWDCDFGTETPTSINCFTGHSTSSVSNYNDIPTSWGGP